MKQTKRKPIALTDSLQDIAMLLAEGNPGALSVIMQLIKADPLDAFGTLLHMDDMNVRGSQIWVGYKLHCKEDLAVFTKAVVDREFAMVQTINANSANTGGYLAVKSGGAPR